MVDPRALIQCTHCFNKLPCPYRIAREDSMGHVCRVVDPGCGYSDPDPILLSVQEVVAYNIKWVTTSWTHSRENIPGSDPQ